jgi:hypothetical protein
VGGSVEKPRERCQQSLKYYWLLKIFITLIRDLSGIELVADMGPFDVVVRLND